MLNLFIWLWPHERVTTSIKSKAIFKKLMPQVYVLKITFNYYFFNPIVIESKTNKLAYTKWPSTESPLIYLFAFLTCSSKLDDTSNSYLELREGPSPLGLVTSLGPRMENTIILPSAGYSFFQMCSSKLDSSSNSYLELREGPSPLELVTYLGPRMENTIILLRRLFLFSDLFKQAWQFFKFLFRTARRSLAL